MFSIIYYCYISYIISTNLVEFDKCISSGRLALFPINQIIKIKMKAFRMS